MGFSTIAAGVVFFAGLLFVAHVMSGAFFQSQRELADSVADDRHRAEFMRATNVTLSSGSWSGGTLDLSFTNTGGTVLDVANTALFLNGVWSSNDITATTVDGVATDLWAPGRVLDLSVSVAAEPARAFFVLETGRGVLWTP